MKKIFIIILLALPICLFSQTVNITLEEDGGVFKVPCEVNGAKMKFIFDTGATMVSLSLSMADYLYENNFIDEYDFEDLQEFMDANGTITEHLIINIRDLSISGLHLKNVKASVNPNQDAPLLLGLSAIQRLGKVSIHGNILTIDVGDEVDELNPTSFLNINFGTSRKQVREILQKKYPDQFAFSNDSFCDRLYDVNLMGIVFTLSFFHFDRSNSLVSGSFVKIYSKNELKQAFKDRDYLADIYSHKYTDIEKELDDNNNYWYGCGGSYFIDQDEFWPIIIEIVPISDNGEAYQLEISYYKEKRVYNYLDDI